MDETELRERLQAALDGVSPPRDLYDRAMLERGSRRRWTRRRIPIGAACLVVVALIVALTVDTTRSRGRVRVVGSPTTISPDLAATTSIDPIKDFIEEHDYGATYRIAVENRVERCMGSRGWIYVPRVANLTNVYGAGDGPTDPTALLHYRQTYGYGYLNPSPVHPEAEAAIDNANSKYVHLLARDRQVRYMSDLGSGPDEQRLQPTRPASGCRGTAEAAERKIIPRLSPAVVNELFTRSRGVVGDPEYLAAQHEWASCMSRSGFQFRLATDAQASISNLFAAPPNNPQSQAPAHAQANPQSQKEAAALEIRTGTADARCAAPTVWPVQRRLELTILQDVIDRYGTAVVCGVSCR
jgi:hypothetical protein